jgi:hypothetical protein
MTTPKKTVDSEAPATDSTRRQRILGWAELGIENAASAQKQWSDITFAYADLALKGWRDTLSWLESYNETSRKTLASIGHAREERAKAILDRLS